MDRREHEEFERVQRIADLYCLLFGMAITRLEEKHGDLEAYGDLCAEAAEREDA